jgi:hypothetical protein
MVGKKVCNYQEITNLFRKNIYINAIYISDKNMYKCLI